MNADRGALDLDLAREQLAMRAATLDGEFTLVDVGPEALAIRHHGSERSLRMQGTVSGPTLLMLADLTGGQLAMATSTSPDMPSTANLTMNFLRPAKGFPITAHATPLRIGRRQTVCAVEIFDEAGELLAHSVVTFVFPTTPAAEVRR